MTKRDMLRLPWAIIVLIFDGLRSSQGRLLILCAIIGWLCAIVDRISEIFRKKQK